MSRTNENDKDFQFRSLETQRKKLFMLGYVFGERLLPMYNIRSCKLSDAVCGHSSSSFVSYVCTLSIYV